MLLQQSSWQNNVRMGSLVEQVRQLLLHMGFAFTCGSDFNFIGILFSQIRGPLSSIRTLSKMLSLHTKRSEVCLRI